MHWSDQYLNRPYVPKTGDCGAFAALIAREVLGLHPDLPGTHEETLRAQAAQIARVKADFALRIEMPLEGHPVLLVSRGDLFHIGVMCRLGGEWWVMHADKTFGAVIRQRLRSMTMVDYKVEGFYQWKS
ncbi:hypothetical protein RAS12_11855 [Achromobacter seleniivolatilans]|uniref:NlpC/P60 domain-containing protein n=1 Tax=Achromobacter seleniivolatilans TaxID=3047478 RepID=A0ABY9M7M2_9BURK|nr:hypothetical protein [Achromobacter sp. R39]WMD23031.1 hypothetical protein RAS12_11855 [Achromobacter sp. R39]